MITLKDISKIFGGRLLFENVNVSFTEHNRYGLTGPNGSGKSTLLKIIMGVEEPNTGTVSLPRRVGFLRQDIESYKDVKVIDTIIMANQALWKAFVERDKIYEAEEITDQMGIRLGELEGIIAEENGYEAESDATILLEGIGVSAEYHNLKMKELPLDFQFRVLLCQALFGEPDALLLDEPTNHLDMGSIGWLENSLRNYKGTLIVVSHDKHFLNSITTHIADIDYETVIIYPGNYDQMLVTKSSVRERSEAEQRSKEKKISQLREFVAKFSAGTRASQVQSRLKEINRLQPQDLKKSNIDRPYIRFYPPEKPSGQIVCKAENLFKSYDANHVIKGFSCEIQKNDKIGIIGNNGRGKTTLLKMLAQVLDPTSGVVAYGHQVDLGYFPQNHTDVVDKKRKISAFEWLKEKKEGVYDQDVRSVLGKMLFAGNDAFKELPYLSGGETARLIIASLMLRNHNFLIMDEPNNHLDLESVSALSQALTLFEGTAIVSSHDRSLIDDFATKIISFEKDKIIFFHGTLEEYLAMR